MVGTVNTDDKDINPISSVRLLGVSQLWQKQGFSLSFLFTLFSSPHHSWAAAVAVAVEGHLVGLCRASLMAPGQFLQLSSLLYMSWDVFITNTLTSSPPSFALGLITGWVGHPGLVKGAMRWALRSFQPKQLWDFLINVKSNIKTSCVCVREAMVPCFN